MNRKNYQTVIRFYVWAYGITWGFWIPLMLSSMGMVTFKLPSFLFFLGALGPGSAAILVSYLHDGKSGIRSLLGRLVIWRVPAKWYAFSILLPFVIVLLVLSGLYLLHGVIPGLIFKKGGEMAAIFFSSILICANEELAWRGFAQSRLQESFSPFRASLVVGFFWGLIHLPLFFIQPERSGGFSTMVIIPLFVLISILLSILYTYQFNRTRGSVLLATLFHTSLNTANEMYSSPVTDYDLTALVLFFGIVALIAVYLITRMRYSSPANPS